MPELKEHEIYRILSDTPLRTYRPEGKNKRGRSEHVKIETLKDYRWAGLNEMKVFRLARAIRDKIKEKRTKKHED